MVCLLTLTLTASSFPAFAQDKKVDDALENPVAISLVGIMIFLLLVIIQLANILLTVAKNKLEKEKQNRRGPATIVTFILMILYSVTANAQPEPPVGDTEFSFGNLSATAFYLMISVILIEIVIAIAMLLNIRKMVDTEKQAKPALLKEAIATKKKSLVSWWDRINRFRPIDQDTNIDLGHEYDGIRELDNRLPPWWLYGFYLTIFIGVIYFWRFHVSHSAPLSVEEYEISVSHANEEIKLYLSKKGEDINENTVVLLSSSEDLAAGKAIYLKSCAICHKENGAGEVGPNLTDDYWLHGNDIKDMFRTIRYGVNAMPQWQNSYSNKQIAQVTSFVKSLHGTNPPNAKSPQGKPEAEAMPATADSAVVQNNPTP